MVTTGTPSFPSRKQQNAHKKVVIPLRHRRRLRSGPVGFQPAYSVSNSIHGRCQPQAGDDRRFYFIFRVVSSLDGPNAKHMLFGFTHLRNVYVSTTE